MMMIEGAKVLKAQQSSLWKLLRNLVSGLNLGRRLTPRKTRQGSRRQRKTKCGEPSLPSQLPRLWQGRGWEGVSWAQSGCRGVEEGMFRPMSCVRLPPPPTPLALMLKL